MGNMLDMEQLVKISEPKYFKKDTMICHEGESGTEMYLVLQGVVLIYISSATDENIFVTQVESGGFFGEMALFGGEPRSATCIAGEDTTCIAINRSNLQKFITACPSVTEKLLASLSDRIRHMNDKLYKASPDVVKGQCLPFEIPAAHADSGHEDKTAKVFLQPMTVKCPVCGAAVSTSHLQVMPGEACTMLKSQRRLYDKIDPLWHFVRSCPSCGYSNYYVSFLKLPDVDETLLQKVVTAEKAGLDGKPSSAFDKVAGEYYRAIHFNECLNGADTVLLGKLWLYLGWLYEDAGQKEMRDYCHERALKFYETTYREKPFLLYNDFCQSQCAMVIGELYWEREEYDKALVYYHAVTAGGNKRLASQAYDRIYERRDMKAKAGK